MPDDPRDVLVMFTIFRFPLDYPSSYVVRGFDITAEGPRPHAQPLAVTNSLHDARVAIPSGLHWQNRSPEDEPQIVESWF